MLLHLQATEHTVAHNLCFFHVNDSKQFVGKAGIFICTSFNLAPADLARMFRRINVVSYQYPVCRCPLSTVKAMDRSQLEVTGKLSKIFSEYQDTFIKCGIL